MGIGVAGEGCGPSLLDRVAAALARTDPHGFFHGQHEDLAVTDLSGARGRGNGFNDFVGAVGGNRDLKAAGKPILPRPYAIAVRKGDIETLRWVNDKLSAMKKDGTYDRLREKYFGAAAGKGGKP